MELIGYFLVIFLGIFFGIITGLIPGVHINLISLLLLTYSYIFLEIFTLNQILIFIVSMSITHTFIDFIPSLVFGVPDSDTALSILPAHKMLLEGKARLAIYLSTIGSLYGVFIAIFMMPIMFLFLETVYVWIKNFVAYLLLIITFFLISLEKGNKNKLWALVIVLFSGGLGLLTLNAAIIEQQLFLLFTGLFGISNLIYSMKSSSSYFPKQHDDIKHSITKKELIVGLSSSGLAGTMCSIFPGLGNAQAGVISTFFMRLNSSELMLVMFGAINTINFTVSFFTFYLIERTRNGSIYVLSQILGTVSFEQIKLYLVLVLVVGILVYFITLAIGNKVLLIASSIKLSIINISLIIILYFLSYFFSGIYGVIVLHLCAMLGLLSLVLGISRFHLMGVLIIPVFFNLI